MIPFKKTLTLDKYHFFKVHLNLINAIAELEMTPREIEVLGTFMGLEGDIAQDRFSTLGRKIVKKKLNLSDGGLGNFLKTLRDKNCIKLNAENKEEIMSYLFPKYNEQMYIFKLIRKDNSTNRTVEAVTDTISE